MTSIILLLSVYGVSVVICGLFLEGRKSRRPHSVDWLTAALPIVNTTLATMIVAVWVIGAFDDART
jgi:hypothetical protein